MPDRLRPELPAGQSEPQNTISSFGLKRNWAIKACLADKKEQRVYEFDNYSKESFFVGFFAKKGLYFSKNVF